MMEVHKLQKYIMKFTEECFKQVSYDEISNLYDTRGKKIKIPTFLDDDEHFIDDDDEIFSSLLPSGCSKNETIPKVDLEKNLKYKPKYIENLMRTI